MANKHKKFILDKRIWGQNKPLKSVLDTDDYIGILAGVVSNMGDKIAALTGKKTKDIMRDNLTISTLAWRAREDKQKFLADIKEAIEELNTLLEKAKSDGKI